MLIARSTLLLSSIAVVVAVFFVGTANYASTGYASAGIGLSLGLAAIWPFSLSLIRVLNLTGPRRAIALVATGLVFFVIAFIFLAWFGLGHSG